MRGKSLLMFCFCLLLIKANAQRPFITTWNTINPGMSRNNQIFFHATGSNYTVSWVNTKNAKDSGSKTASGDDTVTFGTQGIYKVYITPGNGTFTAIQVFEGNFNDNDKLLSVEQWGDINWSTFQNAFYNCPNLVINATDIPDFSTLTDVSFSFFLCTSLTTNAAMNNWDVGNVTNMGEMFQGDISFNQPIGNWNVSKVTDMRSMFDGDYSFNQPVGNWNVSSVTDMGNMFYGDSSFNQPIGNWNVNKVTDMRAMLDGDISFNQPIGNWNVGNVQDMTAMFMNAKSFNQPIGNWNVSKVFSMAGMFISASSFNQTIGNWDVGNDTITDYMFSGATSFNQPIGNWNVGSVTMMEGMFASATAFNQPIANWNVSKVTVMNAMFDVAKAFNQPIGNWNVSNVLTTAQMFEYASAFNQPLSNWNVGSVNYMFDMFQNAYAFNQDIGTWNLGSIKNMENMLDSSGMSCNNYSLTLNGWANSSHRVGSITLGAAGLTYDSVTAKPAHDFLTSYLRWKITGDKIGNCSKVLTVNVLHFSVVQQRTSALLSWNVANEVNIKSYTVEKSANGLNFKAVDFVTAKGTPSSISYTYMDNALSGGINYYRIKELDNDNTYIYSSIKELSFSRFTWKINSNPINNSSVDVMLDKNARVYIQIISADGNTIKTIAKGDLIMGTYHIPLNTDNLSTGIYLVRLIVDDKAYVAMVVKQ